MKKLLLLSVGVLSVISSFGQYANSSAQGFSKKIPFVKSQPIPGKANTHSGARMTSTAFISEDFSSGTDTTLPSGWTTGAISAGLWKWTRSASSSAYTMGAMASSTAANGWMIFNSDSIGTTCSCKPGGWLQSPAYNCSGHPHVRLDFEDYFRKLQDTCYVWVSTDASFSTYASYPVLVNNSLSDDIYSANPENVHINISAAAGGHSSVYIRFVTNSAYTGGSYSWMVDDMALTDIDSVDIGLEKPAVVYAVGSSHYSFGAMPLKATAPVSLATFVSNYGFTAEPSLLVNGQIYQGMSSVYSANVTVNLPVYAIDSLASFTGASPATYYPAALSLYTAVLSANAPADGVTVNNTDTSSFAITDSIWSENPVGGSPTTSFFVYEPGTTAYAYSTATVFGVPSGQLDTLTSVSVSFGPETKPGQQVGVQIYHYNTGTSQWDYDGQTQFGALTSADISTSGSYTYASFAVDKFTSGGYVILHGGLFYAAVVKGYNNTDTVTVMEGNNPADASLIGITSVADTSGNDGAATHLFRGSIGNSLTPFINLNFGPVPDYSGIYELTTENYIGDAYPNPANNTVIIPFTLSQDAVVTITLSNVMGREIASQTINAVAGKTNKAAFSTGSLADGVYLYNVAYGSQKKNGHIVIAH